MRKLDRLCRKLARCSNRYFEVVKFPGYFTVHEYDAVSHHYFYLRSFRRVADVERFLLDQFVLEVNHAR